MCYDVSQLKLRALKDALRNYAPPEVIEKLQADYEKSIKGEWSNRPGFHVNGFEHPPLFTAIKKESLIATRFLWGLIPHWVKSKKDALEIWNKTLNARGETIFEKPAFRDAAKNNRCIIFADGFFEHHHLGKSTYPYFIQRKDQAPIMMGGIWSEWVDKETGEIFQTASIVTTKGNGLMSAIHNNPKAEGPRMPLILESDQLDIWLDSKEKHEIEKIIQPLDDSKLIAHTVRKLKGKESVGDNEKAIEKFDYLELL